MIIKQVSKDRQLTTLRPDIAAQWHPTRNGELTPDWVTVSSGRKVWWQCEKGHEWEAVVGSRSQGHGCPVCAGQKASPGYNDLATVNPELAAQWHPTRNGELTPDRVTVSSDRKAWWQCEKGHEWETRVASRADGSGCPVCAGRT